MNKKIIVGIIDTGTSNIKSVRYALEKVNVEVVEIKEFDNVKIDAMVVPGVGSLKRNGKAKKKN